MIKLTKDIKKCLKCGAVLQKYHEIPFLKTTYKRCPTPRCIEIYAITVLTKRNYFIS